MAEQSPKPLPEIPLNWRDFVWSLEKMRHSPYNKKTRERDWFRVNPLEMVLLGAQSLATSAPAKRDHGTMVLVMPPLGNEMQRKPRYWERLLFVLYRAIQEETTPTTVLERSCVSLTALLKLLEEDSLFYPSITVWAMEELKIVDGLHTVLDKQKSLSSKTRNSIQDLLRRLDDLSTTNIEDFLSGEVLYGERIHLRTFLSIVVRSCSTTVLSDRSIKLLLAPLLTQDVLIPTPELGMLTPTPALGMLIPTPALGSDWSPYHELFQYISTASLPAMRHLLSIVQFIFQYTPEEMPPGEMEASNQPTSSDEEQSDSETSTVVSEPAEKPNYFATLFTSLLTALRKWEELVSPDPASLSVVVSKLLSLTEVLVVSYPIYSSVPVHFLQEPLTLLMTYSTEGYLSDSPDMFLLELLEFVTTVVEHGQSPTQALHTDLPNLFGPVFGVRDHNVSCGILEYGSLAVCSQHRKSLLTEGLRFLVDIFHLFPPVDEVRAHKGAASRRAEAVATCTIIIEHLIASLPLGDAPTVSLTASLEGQDEAGSASLGGQPEVTDAEREADKSARTQVLLRLIKLASAIIRRGDNISFVFASVLPKLFRQTPDVPVAFNANKLKKFFGEEPPAPVSCIPWAVDKKKFAIQLLDLAILSLKNNVATPFQICGIVAPKLVKNVEHLSLLGEEEKMSLVMDVLRTTQEIMEEGHNVDDFISHGIDLLDTLVPSTASADEFRQFSTQMARHFVSSSLSSLLFLIRNACKFMISNFPLEESGIRDLFSSLVFKGKRDEIRGVFRVCRSQLTEDKYSDIRQFFYHFSSGKLSHRQLLALCDLLVLAMDVESSPKSQREVVSSGSDEETEQLLKEREELKRTVASKLTTPCLESIESALKQNRFKKEVWESVSQRLSRVTLFTTLFQSEFSGYRDLSTTQLTDTFTRKFPTEVLASDEMMKLLALSATRIEHIQIPRYDSLKSVLSSHLRHFLTLPSAEGGGTRTQDLQHYLDSLPRNTEDRQQLVEGGYSNRLWEQRVCLTVSTDGARSLEENMRQTLLACYTEFTEILKQLSITHVSVDGELVKYSDLFSDELSLAELKGRRALAVRVIDQRLGQSKDGHFYERKVALLSREDQIESDFEEQSKVPVKPKTFTVAVNTEFFDCAKCCGPQIIGCYAPNGEHCERPLEIGMRTDSAFASVYDEAGIEIENAELLFTHEGVYVFKAYSNGHPYDTSPVWTSLFESLLKEPLVPAVIIPSGYPNTRTWESIRRSVSTEITGSVLTCRHDYSPEWRTYYDHRPEKVRLGTDVVLGPGFSLTSAGEGRPSLQRQRSRLTKDLPGEIFEELMQKLLEDEWLKQFRFLGKVLSEYVSVCVKDGESRTSILEKGFNYERWARTFKSKQPDHLVPSKREVLERLKCFIDDGVIGWLEAVDLGDLCANNHKQLLELKNFLERDSQFKALNKELVKDKLSLTHKLLTQCSLVVPMNLLPGALQEEIIHWVFGNEDRVWRYRGGRDGRETLQQFMSFLGKPTQRAQVDQAPPLAEVPVSGPREVYPGAVVFCVPQLAVSHGQELDYSSLQVRQMVGYAVGEMMKPPVWEEREEGEEVGTRWQPTVSNQCYEVVTAWVHSNYRGLNIGTRMYFTVVEQAPARLVMCDMLVGSVERIIQSNLFLRLLRRVRVTDLIVRKRQMSYTVVTQTGHSEQFEQVLFNTRPLRLLLKANRGFQWLTTHSPPASTIVAVAMAVSFPLAVFTVSKYFN